MNLKLNLLTLLMCSGLGFISAQDLEIQNSPSPQNLAEIFVEESTFEFGTIEQGEVIQNVFEITNLGEAPLVISNAKGSCGCTVPNWPKEPVMPGQTAQILVKFDSKGKRGKQAKRVTITANTEPAQTFLTIRGEINAPEVTGEPEDLESITSESYPTKSLMKNTRVDVNSFVVYPNPTSELLNVELKAFIGEPAEIQLFNQQGKLMESKTIQEVQNEIYSFNVSDLLSGTYVVSTKIQGKMRVAKQIVITN